MVIIFDLDGTIIDSSERMYRLFCDLVSQCSFSKERYWELKRNKVNHRALLNRFFPKVHFEEFNQKWMSMIEEERYLLLDQNYEDTIEVLMELKKHYSLYLLTARQKKAALLEELVRLSIESYFEKILVTENKIAKEELLAKEISRDRKLQSEKIYFVSDMGKDIQVGKSFGYRTVAITHGFMNRERLEEYKPEYVIDRLAELLGICNAK